MSPKFTPSPLAVMVFLDSNFGLESPASTASGQPNKTDRYFYYFAYGSCMCPVDLKRSLGENTHLYVIGPAILRGYRLGFHYYSTQRQCGALDVLPDADSDVHGVLYRLPWHLSDRLDQREGVQRGDYRHEVVAVEQDRQHYIGVRTYAVVKKTPVEMPPNDWYFTVVLRGAVTCRLPEQYCWQLFDYMRGLQMACV